MVELMWKEIVILCFLNENCDVYMFFELDEVFIILLNLVCIGWWFVGMWVCGYL